MSMWEIEALIEDSVRLVAATSKSQAEKRQLIYNLYEMQGQFDCKFTHFRLMPLLLESGFTKTIAIGEHPSYKRQQAFFDGLKEQDFAFIYEKVEQEWEEDNPVTAYWNQAEGKIYYDFGSPLWERLEETEAAVLLAPLELVKTMAQLAHEAQNKNLLYHWGAFALIYSYLFYPSDDDLGQLKKKFQPIKELWNQHDFEDIEPMHLSFDLKAMVAMEDYEMDQAQEELIEWMSEEA